MADEPATGKLKGIMSKKIGGVPVVYLIGGGVVLVLAVVAYRMRDSTLNQSTTASTDTTTDVTGGSDTGMSPAEANAAGSSDVYSGMGSFTSAADGSDYNSTNTVGVPGVSAPDTIQDNTAWVNKGAQWLQTNGYATVGDAQAVLQLYLNGGQLSYQQGQWRDAVISAIGAPPDPPQSGGTAAPASKGVQGTPPIWHVVQGTNDDTFNKLCQLYYNNIYSDPIKRNQGTDLIQSQNTNLGHEGNFPVGTRVFIPAWHPPVYYTTDAQHTTAQSVAAANGISVAALNELNDGSDGRAATKWPVKPGTQIRVA